MPRRIFPASSVTNTTGAPIRLAFHYTQTGGTRAVDLYTVDGANYISSGIPNGIVLTDATGNYSAFAGPDDVDTLWVTPHTGAARTQITATGTVANGTTVDSGTYAQRASNLSDLTSASAARTSLGLGTSAVMSTAQIAADSALTGTYVQALMPEHFGAVGDGVTDDTSALQQLFAALSSAGGDAVLSKTYKTTATLTLTTGTTPINVNLSGKIAYTGTGNAVRIQNRKNLTWRGPGSVDISGAGTNAVGINVAGLWFGTFMAPKVVQGPSGSTGILVETSAAGGNDWGSYLNTIINPDLQTGAGAAGIKTTQTSGDTVSVTHLTVTGGWINAKTKGFDFDHIHGGWLFGTAFETLTGDAIYLSNAGGVVISHGEISVSGYTINFGSGVSDISVLPGYTGGVGSAAGYINTATYTPVQVGAGSSKTVNFGAGQLTAGAAYLASINNAATSNNASIVPGTTGTALKTSVAGNVPLTVQNNNASPSGDLTQWQDKNSAVLSKVDAAGDFIGPKVLIGGYSPTAGDDSAMLAVQGTDTAQKAVVIKGVASGTKNLTEWQNSAGSVLASMDTGGNVRGAGLLNISSSSNAQVKTNTTGTAIQTSVAGNKVLVVQNSNASPSADILQIVATSTAKAAFLPAGTFLSDDSAQGIVLKDSGGHYWRLTVTTGGVVTTADLGTSRPTA